MKKAVYLILKNNTKALSIIEEIKNEGFNGTVLNSDSVRHFFEEYPEEHHFYTLRNYEKNQIIESIMCLFIVDENKENKLKELIRENTNHFKDINGAMFSVTLNDYEGSF